MKTIGSVESFTGGLFASTIISKPGASKFFKGSLVVYAPQIKEKFGIDTSRGLVSKETALSMAQKGKEILDVDYCVSFTGNAGPDVLENKRVGEVYIAINEKVFSLQLSGDRNQIRNQAVSFALKELQKIIGEQNE